jgi:hypothetical protein
MSNIMPPTPAASISSSSSSLSPATPSPSSTALCGAAVRRCRPPPPAAAAAVPPCVPLPGRLPLLDAAPAAIVAPTSRRRRSLNIPTSARSIASSRSSSCWYLGAHGIWWWYVCAGAARFNGLLLLKDSRKGGSQDPSTHFPARPSTRSAMSRSAAAVAPLREWPNACDAAAAPLSSSRSRSRPAGSSPQSQLSLLGCCWCCCCCCWWWWWCCVAGLLSSAAS